MRGVALAQAETNEKDGIRGRWLLVGITDDGYSNDADEAKITKNVADKLVNEMPSIVGVVGHSSSATTLAAGEIYDKKLVAISPTSTAIRKLNNDSQPENLHGLNFSPYVFRTASNDTVAIDNLINYIITEKQQKTTNVAIAYERRDSYSNSFKLIFEKKIKENGLEVVEDESKCNLSFDNFNLEKCVEQTKTADTLLLIPSSEFRTQKLALDLVKKVENVYLLGGDTMYKEDLLSNPEADEMVVAVPWHRSQSDSESRFEKVAIIKFGKKVNWRTAMAYDATQALIKGLEEASTKCSWLNPLRYRGEVTCLRQELKNALSNPNFKADGALGTETVSFENGDRIPSGKCQNSESSYQVGVLVKAVVKDNNSGYFQTLELQPSPVCPDSQ